MGVQGAEVAGDVVGAATSGVAAVAAGHPLWLAHWFRRVEDLTLALDAARRPTFRRECWWIWQADDQHRLRQWTASFCRRWPFWAPAMVHKFEGELHRVLAYLRWPAHWRHRLRTTKLSVG